MTSTDRRVLPVPSMREICCSDPDLFIQRYPDIAMRNLACARGLDTIEPNAFSSYLALIDRIAETVDKETKRCLRIFRIKPAQFHHSEPVYRMMTMEHVFRKRFGIQYDPMVQDRVKQNGNFRSDDSREIFIHGILSEKRTGTCSSLPTFAIAVGRRLGYPLKLVLVPNHTLYRWDDGEQQINFQHTRAGGEIYPDEYFRTWPHRWTEQDYQINSRSKIWLHSLTPKQEISKFLCNRAIMMNDRSRWEEAYEAIAAAERYCPSNPACEPIRMEIDRRKFVVGVYTGRSSQAWSQSPLQQLFSMMTENARKHLAGQLHDGPVPPDFPNDFFSANDARNHLQQPSSPTSPSFSRTRNPDQ